MPNKMTVQEVAKIMGVTPRFLQLALQQGKFPFGIGVKIGKWSYYINTKRFLIYMRIRGEKLVDYMKLKGARVAKGFTQENMAERLDISTKTYNRKGLGIMGFNRREMFELVKTLNLTREEAGEIFLI